MNRVTKAYKTIGILGGMSPASTVKYYDYIIKKYLGEINDHNYPRIVISSVSFQKYIELQRNNNWKAIGELLKKELQYLKLAGADFAIIATNTMHRILADITPPLPVLSIIDAVAAEAKKSKLKNLGLLGTKFTMNDTYYVGSFKKNKINIITPSQNDQNEIHRIIYDELIKNKILTSSIRKFYKIAGNLCALGAEAVVLGCTELELLLNGQNDDIIFLNSTEIHAETALRFSMNKIKIQTISSDF
ncbi:MAG: amino acid racemase [Bacteroidota bacterium]